ncbi:hypothetical protein EAH88_10040 [Rhodanobacter glycinis]|uniref:Uncharacterized protein n=1 Tax=Rhodanobacter glycinis TaxID=582702 RepID=A0A502C6Z3_9GAMM|nr:hypothetical protein [Rhodanobacter glycinis]TPG08583.1 hypothetical protein EAH88_10040 [Rhodanobacter glycinis]
MNAGLRQHVTASHRDRVLRALGVTPWVRRVAADIAEPAPPATDPDEGVACVVVLPEGCSTRELDLLGRALNACGATLARAARVTVRGGQLAAGVPQARAYLVFGEAQAHALGRTLPAAAMHQAQIVLADEPALVLTSAGGKRRLWSALRSLRRTLATAGS